MEDVVKKIIEIEHEAQSLVAEGVAEREKLQMDTRDEMRAMETNIVEMSVHKIDQLRSKSRKEADDKIIRIYEDTALKMRLMEENAEENQGLWENQIFDRILGR